jgi:hypothetical protein
MEEVCSSVTLDLSKLHDIKTENTSLFVTQWVSCDEGKVSSVQAVEALRVARG